MCLRMIAAIPVCVLEPLASAFYLCLYPFLAKERALIYQNVERVYQLPAHSHFAKTFARQVLRSQFLIYLETIKYMFFPERFRIHGRDELRAALTRAQACGKGHVIFTAHLGSWELAGHFGAVLGKRKMYVLAKPSKVRWIDPILYEIRRGLSMNVLWTDTRSLLRDMLKALEHGDGVGFVMDQRPAAKMGGHLVTFMGVPSTSIVGGPALVLAKKHVAATGVYCVREGLCRYRIVTSTPLGPDHELRDEEAISAILAQDMERVIRQYPEQWAWNYRRWKQ